MNGHTKRTNEEEEEGKCLMVHDGNRKQRAQVSTKTRQPQNGVVVFFQAVNITQSRRSESQLRTRTWERNKITNTNTQTPNPFPHLSVDIRPWSKQPPSPSISRETENMSLLHPALNQKKPKKRKTDPARKEKKSC